jgi:hypothetical protein
VVVSILLPCLASFAADLKVTISPGLNGAAKSGNWTCFRLHCVNEGTPFSGVATAQPFSASDEALPESFETPVSLPRGSKKAIFLYVPYDGQVSYWRVQLSARRGRSERVAYEEKISSAIGPQRYVRFLTVPSDNLLLVGLTRKLAADSQPAWKPKNNTRTIQLTAMSVDELPDRWIGLDAADAVVATTDVFQGAMNDRLEAMLQWIATGGHLIVVPNATTSGPFHPQWAKVFGTQITTTVPFEADGPFTHRYGAPPEKCLRSMYDGMADETLLADDRGPLLFRKRHGLGTITFTAADMLGPSWRNWPGLASAWQDLLAPSLLTGEERVLRSRVSYGYDYQSQNLINGLRQIPALRPPSFAMLGAYLCLYLFVMVVVNYLVLRRLDKKEWSLLTFPAIAIVFGIGAYWSGYFLRGGVSVLHQVNLVELAADEPRGVARSFLGYFSAVREPCRLTLPRDSFPQYLLFNYHNPGGRERDVPPLRVVEGEHPTASAPISVWTMRTFQNDVPVELRKGIRGQITLVESNNILRAAGWVEHNLPWNLQQASILIGPNFGNQGAHLPTGKRTEIRWQPNSSVTAFGNHPGIGNQAAVAACQWWYKSKQMPGHAYLVARLAASSLEELDIQSRHNSRQQETIVVVRLPIEVPATQKQFGPNWWEPAVLQADTSNLNVYNWQQKNCFQINRGTVTLRYHLLGHSPGKQLKSLRLYFNPQAGSAPVAGSVSVWNHRQAVWKKAETGKPTEFVAGEVFDSIHGTLDVKVDAGQGYMQLQPQFVQVTGEAE